MATTPRAHDEPVPPEARRPGRRWPPDRRLVGRFVVETMLMLLPLAPYQLLALVSDGWATEAIRHGRQILATERALGIAIEPPMVAAASAHPTVLAVAVNYYDVMHFGVAVVAALLVAWRVPWRWPSLRATFVLASLLGVLVFFVYPVAPPNLLPGADMRTELVSNPGFPFGAMPSLHMAWAVWAAVALTIGGAGSRWRFLAVAAGILHVLLTAGVVVATGHHYVLDIPAGLVVVALAAAGTTLLGTARGDGQDASRWRRLLA